MRRPNKLARRFSDWYNQQSRPQSLGPRPRWSWQRRARLRNREFNLTIEDVAPFVSAATLRAQEHLTEKREGYFLGMYALTSDPSRQVIIRAREANSGSGLVVSIRSHAPHGAPTDLYELYQRGKRFAALGWNRGVDTLLPGAAMTRTQLNWIGGQLELL